jgi:hypothetical protein
MSLIDAFLPAFQFRERHMLLADASPAALLDAVTQPGTIDDPWAKAFINLRELPGRALGRFGGGQLRSRTAFGLDDFVPLGRDADREIAFGLAGQFWRFDYGLRPMRDAETFKNFAEAGVPKLVLNFTAERLDGGRTRLSTETRVFCNTRRSRLQFTPYWWLIRPVSGLIRRRLLGRVCAAARATQPAG